MIEIPRIKTTRDAIDALCCIGEDLHKFGLGNNAAKASLREAIMRLEHDAEPKHGSAEETALVEHLEAESEEDEDVEECVDDESRSNGGRLVPDDDEYNTGPTYGFNVIQGGEVIGSETFGSDREAAIAAFQVAIGDALKANHTIRVEFIESWEDGDGESNCAFEITDPLEVIE